MYFQPVKNFDSLPSTNTRLREMLGEDPALPGGLVVCATSQTQGRGRFERKWITPAGQCLTFSAMVRMNVPAEYLLCLPLVTGVAVVETLKQLHIAAKLKWPNDVLVNGKKICGILCENVSLSGDAPPAAIVGVGLNVNLPVEIAAEIDQPATSMLIETSQKYCIPGLFNVLLEELDDRVAAWAKDGFAAVRQAWLANTDDMGMEAEVRGVGEIFPGTITGLGRLGQLIVTDHEGQPREVLEGDVKVTRK